MSPREATLRPDQEPRQPVAFADEDHANQQRHNNVTHPPGDHTVSTALWEELPVNGLHNRLNVQHALYGRLHDQDHAENLERSRYRSLFVIADKPPLTPFTALTAASVVGSFLAHVHCPPAIQCLPWKRPRHTVGAAKNYSRTVQAAPTPVPEPSSGRRHAGAAVDAGVRIHYRQSVLDLDRFHGTSLNARPTAVALLFVYLD